MNVLVIDVGTSGMRGILFDESGKVLFEKKVSYQVSYLSEGIVEQNPNDWKNALYTVIRQITVESGKANLSIDAIAITSQRSSVFPVDKNISPLANAIMWQDKRTNTMCENMSDMNDPVFERSGAKINPVFSGPKMKWIRQNLPDVYANTYKFVVIPDYLIYLMTGNLVTDYTYGSRSLLMNLRIHTWDPELLQVFEIEKDKLCELIPPGSICGYTTADFAEKTGCLKGIPVITAGGDQQCGAVGQGVVHSGVLSVTTGTGGFLITQTDEIPENLTQEMICNCSAINGKYILESSVLTCTSALNWFQREFFPDKTFEELNKLTSNTPVGSNGCLCVPYFMGRSTPDWNNKAMGIFANITLHTTKNDMLRSLLEGICFEIRNGIETMKKYTDITDMYINGGLSQSVSFLMKCRQIYII